MTSPRVAYVFAGGDPLPVALATRIASDVAPRGDDLVVIAADSGYEHARAVGCDVDLLVGDLDSIPASSLDLARSSGTTIETHPRDKDATDLELAIEAGVRWGADRVVVVGGHGGRVDHLLGNVLLAASPRFAAVEIDVLSGAGRLYVVHRDRTLAAAPGDLCTLLPVHGTAHGVRTDGLRWRLDDEMLHAGSSRGISNEVVAPRVRVQVGSGTVLVALPVDAAGAGVRDATAEGSTG